jgi:hypothetical protein
MMPVMVKEADLNRVDVPEDYEVLDATALVHDQAAFSVMDRCS